MLRLENVLKPAAAAVIRTLARPAASPRSDRGVLLDPELFTMLRLAEPIMSEPDDPVRYRREILRNSLLGGPDLPRGLTTSKHNLAGRSAVMYTPSGLQNATNAPLVLYFHGGGFVVGCLKSHHTVCAALAARSNCRVLAFDYRLAPEHPWPAAPDDAFAAFNELRSAPDRFGVDPERIVLCGDSAGGNLAVVTMFRCRDAGSPGPHAGVLLYPGLEFTRSMKSHETFKEGYFLTGGLIAWFMHHYLPDSELQRNPDVSPWYQTDLTRLPKMAVISAGFDPLRDEAEAFAHRLIDAKILIRLRCEEDQVHGFASMAGLSRQSNAALSRAALDIKWALTS